ncbi:hypothetical protein DFJ74DRAFT_666278 [Hyaloraphidium curvatum]|nr:hypothetical protein DFJ74DRAFT_666278 [Hyaloraphidium curvatum]
MEEKQRKRSVVARACDRCISGRRKCDGASPCSRCSAGGRECAYTRERRPPGPKPGRLRELEERVRALTDRRTAGPDKAAGPNGDNLGAPGPSALTAGLLDLATLPLGISAEVVFRLADLHGAALGHLAPLVPQSPRSATCAPALVLARAAVVARFLGYKHTVGRDLCAAAKKLLMPIVVRESAAPPDLDTVEALLHLGVYCAVSDDPEQLLLSHRFLLWAVSLAKELGLHDEIPDLNTAEPRADLVRRRAVFWAIASTERAMAFMDWYSPSFRDADVRAGLPDCDEDGQVALELLPQPPSPLQALDFSHVELAVALPASLSPSARGIAFYSTIGQLSELSKEASSVFQSTGEAIVPPELAERRRRARNLLRSLHGPDLGPAADVAYHGTVAVSLGPRGDLQAFFSLQKIGEGFRDRTDTAKLEAGARVAEWFLLPYRQLHGSAPPDVEATVGEAREFRTHCAALIGALECLAAFPEPIGPLHAWTSLICGFFDVACFVMVQAVDPAEAALAGSRVQRTIAALEIVLAGGTMPFADNLLRGLKYLWEWALLPPEGKPAAVWLKDPDAAPRAAIWAALALERTAGQRFALDEAAEKLDPWLPPIMPGGALADHLGGLLGVDGLGHGGGLQFA